MDTPPKFNIARTNWHSQTNKNHQKSHLYHILKTSIAPEKMMVGKLSFPFKARPIFRGELVNFQGVPGLEWTAISFMTWNHPMKTAIFGGWVPNPRGKSNQQETPPTNNSLGILAQRTWEWFHGTYILCVSFRWLDTPIVNHLRIWRGRSLGTQPSPKKTCCIHWSYLYLGWKSFNLMNPNSTNGEVVYIFYSLKSCLFFVEKTWHQKLSSWIPFNYVFVCWIYWISSMAVSNNSNILGEDPYPGRPPPLQHQWFQGFGPWGPLVRTSKHKYGAGPNHTTKTSIHHPEKGEHPRVYRFLFPCIYAKLSKYTL